MWLFYLFAFFAVITFVLVPFASQFASDSMDSVSVAYTTLMVRGLPFSIMILLMHYFEYGGITYTDMALAFQPDAVLLSSVELIRAICLIVAFTLIPPTIGQSVFFSFPLMIILLSHFMLNIALDVPLLIGAIVAFVGVLMIVLSGMRELENWRSWRFALGVLCAFIGAFGEAFETVVLKKEDIQTNVGPLLQMYAFFTFACIVASILYFGVYIWVCKSKIKMPDDAETFIHIVLRLFFTSFLSTIFYYVALIGIPAQIFAFLPFIVILFTVILEAVVKKAVISKIKGAGIALMIIGGVGSIVWMHFF